MSWQPIAYKDLHDAGRSWGIWVLFVLFLVLFVGLAVIESYTGGNEFRAFIGGIAGVVALVLPAIGLLLGYKSIAHERINGSIVLLLSFPHSRRDVVLGKYIGRSVVLLVPTLLALLVALVVGGVLLDGLGTVVWSPWFLLLTAVYGLIFLSIAMAISMSTTVDRRVTLGALGAYILIVTFWDDLVTALLILLYRFNFDILFDPPGWSLFAQLLKPSESYYRLLHIGFEVDQAAPYIAPEAPWYVDWWVALLVLLAWIVVPVAIAFYRFDQQDL